VQRVCFALFVLLALVAAPVVAHADPILMTSSGSGLSALFESAGSNATSGTHTSSALTALDFSGDPLDAVLFDVPAGTNLPPVEPEDTNDSATISLGLGPVVAYNLSWGPSSAPFNLELVGLVEPQISNVSFQSGTGPAPKLPPGIGPVAVPEPVVLLLLAPAAALALRRRRRRKAAR
jgi:hypothetical protein